MTKQPFRVGCGAGFAGDRLGVAGPVVDALASADGPAALIFETLAERTLALAQLERSAGRPGYDIHILDRLAPVLATCLRHGIKIVGNFGAADPRGAADAITGLAARLGCRPPRIAIVSGDDLLAGPHRHDLDTILAASVPQGKTPLSANAYLGAREIAAALADGAEIVVTGRVADPALALGPLVAHFGWNFGDHDLIAAGTLVGHLLECGAQVTGGYFADPGFKDVPNLHDVGFPIAEVAGDGTFVLLKPPGTGGCVTEQTVKEQILYEIHDPASYLTPDVVLDLTGVEVASVGPDRVFVQGARGHPAPERLKATVCYDGGYLGEGEISYAGPNALMRAEAALDILARRLDPTIDWRGDLIGAVSVFADDAGRFRAAADLPDSRDVRLRVAVRAECQARVAAAMHEVGALYTCGPAGGAGIRISVRPRVFTASALIPRDLVEPARELVEAGS